MAKQKKTKVDSQAVRKRAEPKPPPDEENQEDVTVCKDFVTVRWETTEQGQLAVWQIPDDDDEAASLSILPG